MLYFLFYPLTSISPAAAPPGPNSLPPFSCSTAPCRALLQCRQHAILSLSLSSQPVPQTTTATTMAAAEAAAGSSSAPAQQQQQQTLVIRSPLDRKQDVFDAADFDPTKFINQIYPDGRLGRVCRQRPAVLDARAPPCNCCVAATAQRRRWETLTGSLACSRSRYAWAWLSSSTAAQA